MPKKFTAFRLPPDLIEWMETQERSQTELVIEAITLLSEIEMPIIKELAAKYRCHPGLVVDIAVRYFSKLEEVERLKKIWDYWEDRRLELESIEKKKAEEQK